MLASPRGSRPSAAAPTAATAARRSAGRWGEPVQLLREALRYRLGISAGIHTLAVSACGKRKQWQQALSLLGEMGSVMLEPDVISTTP
ncbi:unnamed protein product [Prorocentrum cordatum]|uniref:Uncharacterized protein n=1 Tax=Prorocentrum cordatum TaxID=2364126 RepID=A0ABN9VHJ8_9DINO|nr:unnamed protein product [Polarella glacialis]